ncbi:MAG: hypothetical protein JWO95_853 [Verrucomicrobiales bacterium]|nr:hypothetical protein [Verrucomicrobiales bacterium]
MQRNSNIAAFLGLILFLTASGCSSFHKNWRAAALQTPTDDISGRWTGTWKSDSNGHNDKLRCIISKIDEQHYSAQFHAKYKKILSFSYTVSLIATNDASGRHNFKGEADLGKLAGGRYTYEGFATPTNFFSRYNSKYDHGIFELSRIQE